MTLEQIFKSTDWHKKWSVNNFTFAGSSFISEGYGRMVKRYGRGLLHNFFVWDNGTIICYQSEKENNSIGEYIARKIKRNKAFAKELSSEALGKSQSLRVLMKQPVSRLFDPKSFEQFSEACFELVPPFVAVIRSGNFLTESGYADSLKIISKTRVLTESILIEMEDYVRKFLVLVAKKEQLRKTDLTVLSWKEIYEYVKSGKLPRPVTLGSRSPVSGFVWIKNKQQFLNSKLARKLAQKIAAQHKIISGYAKGQKAFPGKVRGRARIIQNPKNAKKFNTGDILITGMTRPDFVPLMKKAGAIVTDAGGVLCHAAIVARELKKPCIIGTQTATLSFKNGDRVIVDANQGTIKKL